MFQFIASISFNLLLILAVILSFLSKRDWRYIWVASSILVSQIAIMGVWQMAPDRFWMDLSNQWLWISFLILLSSFQAVLALLLKRKIIAKILLFEVVAFSSVLGSALAYFFVFNNWNDGINQFLHHGKYDPVLNVTYNFLNWPVWLNLGLYTKSLALAVICVVNGNSILGDSVPVYRAVGDNIQGLKQDVSKIKTESVRLVEKCFMVMDRFNKKTTRRDKKRLV